MLIRCCRGRDGKALEMSRWIMVWVGCSVKRCSMILYIWSAPLGRPTPYWCVPAALLMASLWVLCMAVAVILRIAVPTASGRMEPFAFIFAASCVVKAASREHVGKCPCCKRVMMMLRLFSAVSSSAMVAQCSLWLPSGPICLFLG